MFIRFQSSLAIEKTTISKHLAIFYNRQLSFFFLPFFSTLRDFIKALILSVFIVKSGCGIGFVFVLLLFDGAVLGNWMGRV